MKNRYTYIVLFVVLCFFAADLSASSRNHDHHSDLAFHFGMDGLTIDDINIDYDNDDLTVKNTFEKTSFKISADYELYVNGTYIETNSEQKKLVETMYRSIDEIINEAKEIGWQGAKVGAEGAKLGLQAVVCVFKLLSSNYDVDDLEEEIERKAEKIEKKAEIIEERAEILEEMAIELSELTKVMKKEIPALQELSWF